MPMKPQRVPDERVWEGGDETVLVPDGQVEGEVSTEDAIADHADGAAKDRQTPTKEEGPTQPDDRERRGCRGRCRRGAGAGMLASA